MKYNKFGVMAIVAVLIFTMIDTIIVFMFLSFRSDMMATFPLVGEVISESFNLIFAFMIMLFICLDRRNSKVNRYLIVASVLFYISMLHDLYDEFFISTIISASFEVFAFPFALIIATIGISKAQNYREKLYNENEKLKLQYRDLSYIDCLTGLYNTRHFYENISDHLTKMLDEKRSLTLMMLDIDDFKTINDTYGHLEGDHLIAMLSDLLLKSFGESNFCYRYGGEEFVVVLNDSNLERAFKLADEFRQTFSEQIYYIDTRTYQSSVSVGLSTLTKSDNIKSLLDNADKAMYEAKSRGKNIVCC